MTDTFWIAATVLIILALSFVLYPVFFHRLGARKQTDLKNQNLMAYRSRMKELDSEYEAGILDDENYRQLKEELAGSMLDDVPEQEQVRPVISGRRSAMAVALVSNHQRRRWSAKAPTLTAPLARSKSRARSSKVRRT